MRGPDVLLPQDSTSLGAVQVGAETAAECKTSANDADVAMQWVYPADLSSSAGAKWRARRLAAGPPFRPRFMVYTGSGSPEMTGERVRQLQELGAESFLLAADLPSQLGFDPDHELSQSQVGRAGVSCATLDDFRRVCADLDLRTADSLGMLANSVGHIGTAMVACVLEERDATHVALVMQNDPLKEFTARGTEIFTPEQSLRIAIDAVAYAIDHGLRGYPITVCSNHYDVAGAGPVVAVALAFANAIEYLDELVRRGYGPAEAARHMMFFLNERSDLFLSAGLYRTARRIWADILADRYGVAAEAQEPIVLMSYAHGLETADEPLVNVARCAISVTGAVLGGVEYLCAAAYDEALRTPSLDAAALALRTMQVVSLEHGVSATLDPLADAPKLASVERQIEAEIRRHLEVILDHGGAIACTTNGYTASLLDEGRGRRERQIERGDRAWVGVNQFARSEYRHLFRGASRPAPDLAAAEMMLVERIASHRNKYGGACVAELAALRAAAAGHDNLLPVTIAALRAGATIQQIVEGTRAGFDQGST